MSVGKALRDFRLGKSTAKTAKEAARVAREQERQNQGFTAGDAAGALARRE